MRAFGPTCLSLKRKTVQLVRLSLSLIFFLFLKVMNDMSPVLLFLSKDRNSTCYMRLQTTFH